MKLAEFPDVGRVDDVAAVLDIDPRTVRGLIERGELEAVRAGRLIRVTKPALLAYLGLVSTDDPVGPHLRLVGGGDG